MIAGLRTDGELSTMRLSQIFGAILVLAGAALAQRHSAVTGSLPSVPTPQPTSIQHGSTSLGASRQTHASHRPELRRTPLVGERGTSFSSEEQSANLGRRG